VSAPAADTATLLALERTRVAYERTMMAWVRTGTSLITFGFAVYKFFQLDAAVKLSGRMLVGPREFAMALILIGLLALVLGTVEHARDLRSLRKLNPQLPGSLSRWVSVAMVLLGVVALVAVVTHA
jgi:putative membrane protein